MMTTWLQQIGCLTYDCLDSTNAEAKRLARAGHPPTWILAQKQDNGRGSRGRSWSSKEGNFTASLLFYPLGNFLTLSNRSFVAGLAIYDSVKSLGIKDDRILLKWPNDLLLDQKKLSGILLETVQLNKHAIVNALIVGIGLNLISSPQLDRTESSLLPIALRDVLGCQCPSAYDFLTLIAKSFLSWEKVYVEQGFSVIKSEWQDRTIPLGSIISIKDGQNIIKGKFDGIDNQGSLRVLTKHGIKVFSVADIFF